MLPPYHIYGYKSSQNLVKKFELCDVAAYSNRTDTCYAAWQEKCAVFSGQMHTGKLTGVERAAQFLGESDTPRLHGTAAKGLAILYREIPDGYAVAVDGNVGSIAEQSGLIG